MTSSPFTVGIIQDSASADPVATLDATVVRIRDAAARGAQSGGEDLLRAVVRGYDGAARINYALDAEALAASLRSTHSVGGTFGAGAAAGTSSASRKLARTAICIRLI